MNLVRAQRLVPATPPKSWTLPRLEHQAMKPLSLKHPQSLLRKAKKGGVLVYPEPATGLCRNALIWRGVTSGLSGRSPVSTEVRKPKSCRCAGLPGQCSAYASPSAKAGGAVRGLLCVVYPGTLRPCHHGLPAPGGQSHVETALKSHLGQTKTERNQAAKETPSESVNSDGVLLFEKGYKRFLIIPRSADT